MLGFSIKVRIFLIGSYVLDASEPNKTNRFVKSTIHIIEVFQL